MRNFLFKKIKFGQEDKKNPLFYSLASRMKIPYLLNSIIKEGSALDLGCGTGFLSNLLAQNFPKVTAIDPDKRSVEKARNFYKMPNLEFRQGEAETIPLADNSIDFLLCSEVLEHVNDLEETLHEIKRVCKPNSKFFITVPSIDGLFGNFFLEIGHSDSNQYEEHKRLPFRKKNITKLLFKNDFQIDKIYYSEFFLAEIFIGLIKIVHNLIKSSKPISGQADILMPPKIYKIIFPCVLFLAKLENFILDNFFKGHSIIIIGRIKK